MSKKLIIWDFDGVIADTEKIWLQNRMELINEKFGKNWDMDTTISFLAGMSDKTKKDVLEKLGIKTDDVFWKEAILRDLQKIVNGIMLTPGIEEIFKLQDFEQCIATGGTTAKTEKKIKSIGIEKYFPPEKIFTADMVAYGKPEPDLFLLAAKNMGFERENCFVVEDSLAGIRAGICAGMNVIAFLSCELYNNLHIEEEIVNIGVSAIFHNMKDVKDYLLRKL
ncbi:MAG: HAD family phosphatase [Alphaproteobacteria bacterium]|nr:HAD family phosphatase [Alphaproteobacteria bacterium]